MVRRNWRAIRPALTFCTRKHTDSDPPKGAELKRLLTADWELFEAWIREKIDGMFLWKVRPRDTPANRALVIESICSAMARNEGSFPQHDAFLERDEH